MNILLIEPNFPYPTKSKNQANEIHKNFVPIGLLKLGAYHKSLGDKAKLVRGKKSKNELNYFNPDKILITSLFTYWSKYVWDTVQYYRDLFPESEIIIGGIYVTLHYKYSNFRKLVRKYRVKPHIGLHLQAEKFLPDYSLLSSDVDYHLMHGMRGCIRRCKFCGVWKVEPKLIYKKSSNIINEIISVGKNKVIFLDNNFFANPYKKEILKELADLRIGGKPVIFESQSGFDGRLLENDTELAILLKKARFQNVRIAWDNSVKDASSIKKQINLFKNAGYPVKDISIFMLYNFEIPYEEMIKKYNYCKKWGVQVSDCRYRPIEAIFDNYNPNLSKRGQTKEDYYIHSVSRWTDRKIRMFRKKIREHNIEIRYARDKGKKYDKKMEWWSAIHNIYKFFNLGRPPRYERIEKSRLLLKRINLMKQARNICEKYNLLPPNVSNPSKKNINKKLEKFIKENTKFSE